MAPLKGTGATKDDVSLYSSDSTLVPVKSNKQVLWAWRISLGCAILALTLLPLFRPDPYFRILSVVPDGIMRTFIVTILSLLLALLIGLLTGLGQITIFAPLRIICTTYVEVVRGIPLLIQLFYIYYALGKFIALPAMLSAIIAMGFCYGAYISEIFRAGMTAIPKGQMEASLALGLTRTQTIIYVILPQTFRSILPPIGNEFIALLKDSSLVSILAIADLSRRGREFSAATFTHFETYTVIALVYLTITLIMSKGVAYLEERTSYYEK